MAEHPELEDFGITPEEYRLYAKRKLDESTHLYVTRITFGVVFIALCVVGLLLIGWNDELVCMSLAAAGVSWFAAAWIEGKVIEYQRTYLLTNKGQRIAHYEDAVSTHIRIQWEAEQEQQAAERARREVERIRQRHERAQRRVTQNYWRRMSGVEFEQMVGELFEDMGFSIEMTPPSGDDGVDLEIRKNQKRYVVQCKQQKRRASPEIARALLGSQLDQHADGAILVCTGGFSIKTQEFAQRNSIWLVSVDDLTKLALEARLSQLPGDTVPFCPRCREPMVQRAGFRGKFWGCPKFPDCWGTRDIYE